MNNEIAGLIKQLAVDAVNAQKPADIVFGSVISTQPLRIRTDQKIVLEENCLILCRSVTEHYVDMSIAATTDESVGYDISHRHGYSGETALSEHIDVEPHSHSYSGNTAVWSFVVPPHSHKVRGRKKVLLHLGLKTGETVIMLRLGGGQKFLVIDRAAAPHTEGEWSD
ncbi:MAG: DUF2577 domain-containing protein [Firmicutes bacterium]|nr:DUF2577 domain-containing protein [Bacillota bacterium]